MRLSGLVGEMNAIDPRASRENECCEGPLVAPAIDDSLVCHAPSTDDDGWAFAGHPFPDRAHRL